MTSTFLAAESPGKSQKLTPCQAERNSCHQRRSRWNSVFSLIEWSRLRKQQRRSIMCLKKVRPGQTTFAAWCRWPMRDSNCRLVHHLRDRHEWISSLGASSFSAGSRVACCSESSSIPNTTIRVVGPSHLPG